MGSFQTPANKAGKAPLSDCLETVAWMSGSKRTGAYTSKRSTGFFENGEPQRLARKRAMQVSIPNAGSRRTMSG